MTSVKCFGSWLKEAGRGHLTALFGWTTFFIYTVLLVMRLSLDTSYTFFGIGNTVLLWLSMGLGVLFSFLEFFYLLQQKKQDFYYSLPVFWRFPFRYRLSLLLARSVEQCRQGSRSGA